MLQSLVRALCYNTPPISDEEGGKKSWWCGAAVLLLPILWQSGTNRYADLTRSMATVPVNGDSLPGPSQDEVGSLVRLRQRPADGIYAYEDEGADVEVLAHKGIYRGRTRLHWLKASHDTFEAGGEVLGAAGSGVFTSNSPGSLRLVS